MPVRDGARFLPDALDSILDQTFADFELIVVDNGSVDATPGILEDYRHRDARLRTLNMLGGSIVEALNAGVEAATGAYVARMDADDVARPERLATQFAFLETEPEVVVLGTSAIEIDAIGMARRRLPAISDRQQILRALAFCNPIIHPTVMMRRDAVCRAGSYRRASSLAEDYDLWIRMARIGEIANLEETLLSFRRHPGQISQQRRLDQRAATALVRQMKLLRDAGLQEAADMSSPFHLALETFLAGRHAMRTPISVHEAADLGIMLRALNASKPASLKSLRKLARRVSSEAGTFGARLLPLQFLLRR